MGSGKELEYPCFYTKSNTKDLRPVLVFDPIVHDHISIRIVSCDSPRKLWRRVKTVPYTTLEVDNEGV